ncbi:MAG: MEDS domain-containing protein [Mycobacterium sp.]|uniref:MEDS domain-containing protein n=1 Tax=Mycobacterium sp. TaxID=1785 RepID=UPI001EB6C6B1|nr:MEDS domain-containing protein [Mycobacterium sp.]MBW0017462.1 MEDS domain-containing protein [Mycobacterium sp.]
MASASALVPFGHVGWGYRNRAEFAVRAAEYIADGLDENQSIEYVGEGSREALRAELADMSGIRDRLGVSVLSRICVTPWSEYYRFRPGTDVVDPESTVHARVKAVESAIDSGYTGLRVVVDATPVSRRREQRDAAARFEFLIDRQLAARPASTLCGYDLAELGEHAAEFLCLHPFVSEGSSSFRIYAKPEADFALSGEIDAASTELFATALRRTWSPATEAKVDDNVVIDAQGLEFISQRQLRTLDQYARTYSRDIVLRTGQRIPARLAGVLDLTNVRVESPSADGQRD